MDIPFISGLGAFISAILLFCGSAFLLLMLVMGARLAYFVTASITLAFVLIMGVVWSINPLGPVGQLPEWDPVAIAANVEELDFGPASTYPEDPWEPPGAEDVEANTMASDLETSAANYLEEAVQAGELEGFPAVIEQANVVDEEATVLLEQDGRQYGATAFEVLGDDPDRTHQVFAVMEYDPGNPLGLARTITVGTFVLLVLHLVGLSMSEKRARREREPVPA